MGMFGMSKEGKNAQNALNGNAADNTRRANEYANTGADQQGRANSTGDNLYSMNYDAAANGMGGADSAHNAGEQILGDQSGDMAAQRGRLNDLQSYYGNNYTSPADAANNLRTGVGGYRDQQGQNINDNLGQQQGFTNKAYDGLRTNLSGYTNNTNALNVGRQSNLAESTNGAYNGMDARNVGVHGQLTASNNTAYGSAMGRLTGAMDLNGATAMRATAPLMASAKARMRAAGVDSNSPEGASLMSRVDQSRAHALDDSLMGNIGAQNNLTLNQDATNRGLSLDQLQQTNALAGKQNELSRADTNQMYDAQQGLENTRLQQGNAINQGEYGDTRQNFQGAYNDRQNLANTQAQDQYTQANTQQQNQQQDFQNRSGMTAAQNGVDQQNMQYKTNAGMAGSQWANANANVQQNARNGLAGQYNTQQNAALGYSGATQNASNAAAGGYGNIQTTEGQNANWMGKGLMGIGSAVAGAAASKLIPGK